MWNDIVNWLSTGINIDKISFISAVIGGLITAIFSYIVHLVFFEKDKRERRKRVAYLYFVRISQLLGLRKVIESENEAPRRKRAGYQRG